ncbi:MAG TPA: SRPBCC domain-containing protein [Acidimicrobiales bacterium]
MDHEQIEFFVPEEGSRTALLRTFRAPLSRVFEAWTSDALVAAWWGPLTIDVTECELDFREGGAYRIAMRHESGPDYTATGTFNNIVIARRFTMVNDLSEHPDDWMQMFRPRGSAYEDVPVVWNYDVSFEDDDDEHTTVKVLTTYPIREDRDRFVSLHGESGWAESFVKLDRLLAR